MTESTPPLDQLLLDAKLQPPVARAPGVVDRGDLVDLVRGSGNRFVSVTAPAGYGKTTLLAQWADADDRSVAYVSLDRFDDDPVRLMALLAAAYERISPGSNVIAEVIGPGVSVLGRAAPRFAAALRASPADFVLMLDDLHKLESPECHDVLGVVMSGVPPHSQIVLAGRAEQPNVPRLRASGEVTELGAAELALDPTAAQQVFAARQVSITPEQASLVTRRTEGWPVGLSLAALIAVESDGDPLAITGDDRYLADYLYGESLRHLPVDVRTFLRRTAVLEALAGPLCDAVLQRPGSQAILRHLEQVRMFLLPLDRQRGWYRYHDLFREFLLGELRRLEPDSIPGLHLRAAEWYETNGAPEKSVEHLLNTDERARCARLVVATALSSYQAGQMTTIARWLTELGESGTKEYPPLAVLAGELATLQGQTAAAERWMAMVDESSYDGVPVNGTASFSSSRAILRSMLCQHGPDEMLNDARLALAQEPSWSPWLDTVLILNAEAHLLTGDRERAGELFEEASAVAERVAGTDNHIIAESELAILAMDREALDDAARHAERALAAVEEHRMHDYGTALIAFVSGARVKLLQGDMDGTRRRLTEGMRARQYCTAALPYLAVRSRLQLAKVWLALADLSAARHLLREIDDIMHVRPELGLLVDEVEAFRAAISSNTARTLGATPLTPAELRVIPYLQTHLTAPEIAARLLVSRNTVRTQLASIYRKLGAGSRTDAVDKAVRVGLLGG